MHKRSLPLVLLALVLGACQSPPAQRVDVTVSGEAVSRHTVSRSRESPQLPGDQDKTRSRVRTKVTDVWILDIGQGTCVFVACPDGKSNVVIDCGTAKAGATNTKDIARWINEKNLDAENVTLLISHGHEDHYSNFTKTRIRAEPFTQILLGGQRSDYPTELMTWAKSSKAKPTFFAAGEFRKDDQRLACGAATFDLLTANATELPGISAEESKENADSVVVRLNYAGHTAVFPGDAEGPTERSALKNAIENGINLKGTSLLVSSHHGARTGDSNSAEWLDGLAPSTVLFSANVTYDTYRHPSCERVEAFAKLVGATAAKVDLTCGSNTGPIILSKKKRLISTYDNGHVRARISSAGITYACELKTAACDEQLTEAEMP